MTRFPKIMLSAAALVLAPLAPALAADYEPPVVVNAPDQFVPVEVGTGWYLRGDIAYGVNKSFKNIDFVAPPLSHSEDETTFSGSIGFGYHFTDWLRADLNLGYLPGNKVSASDGDKIKAAIDWIKSLTSEPEVGAIYDGKVVKVVDFGAFVNFFGAKDGLVHVSQISKERVNKPSDILTEGQIVKVKLIGFDDRGKTKLSMKVVDQETGEDLSQKQEPAEAEA